LFIGFAALSSPGFFASRFPPLELLTRVIPSARPDQFLPTADAAGRTQPDPCCFASGPLPTLLLELRASADGEPIKPPTATQPPINLHHGIRRAAKSHGRVRGHDPVRQ
jgi:hypothetical protein